jgi:hypothetical protein
MDLDTQILNYIAEKGIVRIGQLVEHFTEEGFKKNGNKEASLKKNKEEKLERSERTIHRRLRQMTNREQIITFNSKQFKKYGIEDPDGRAKYVALKNITEITEHMDKILKKLDSEEPIKQKMALKEIARYEQIYVLNPKELDLVVTQFYKGIDKEIIDDELADKILFLLYTYILKKNIEPTNETKTIDLLVKLLDKYPVPKNVNIRTHIIYLLGHYGHKAVIQRFIEDARTLQDPFSVENDYNTEYTANIIEKHREELYKLEEEFAIEGRDYASQFVSNIRTHALINLGYHKNPFTKGKK